MINPKHLGVSYRHNTPTINTNIGRKKQNGAQSWTLAYERLGERYWKVGLKWIIAMWSHEQAIVWLQLSTYVTLWIVDALVIMATMPFKLSLIVYTKGEEEHPHLLEPHHQPWGGTKKRWSAARSFEGWPGSFQVKSFFMQFCAVTGRLICSENVIFVNVFMCRMRKARLEQTAMAPTYAEDNIKHLKANIKWEE